MEPMILDRPRDDKYIVFKRDQFYGMMGRVALPPGSGAPTDVDCAPLAENIIAATSEYELEDAVVIRRRDIFAAPALEAYANNILAAIEVVKAVTPGADAIKNLQEIADYFQWQAAAAWADTDQHIPD